MTKKALIIASLDHASPRIPGLLKYMGKYGWEATVLSPPHKVRLPQGAKVIETAFSRPLYSIVRKMAGAGRSGDVKEINTRRYVRSKLRMPFMDKLLNIAGSIVNYPDNSKGWIAPGTKAALEYIEGNKVDAILSTSSPVSSHVIASKVKKAVGLPWLADLRDLWSQNHTYYYGPFRKMLDVMLEKGTIGRSDAMSTVSMPWVGKLKTLHHTDDVHLVRNGYDPQSFSDLNKNGSEGKMLTLAYTGNIYPKEQNVIVLIRAVKELKDEGKIVEGDLEIRFYGPPEPFLVKAVDDNGVRPFFKMKGVVDRAAVAEVQAKTDILLLFNWEDKEEKGVYPAKIFEYLAAERPVLATGGFGDDVIEELLVSTKAGVYAMSVPRVKALLMNYLQEKSGKGKIEHHPDVKEIVKYSYPEMAKIFCSILDKITNR